MPLLAGSGLLAAGQVTRVRQQAATDGHNQRGAHMHASPLRSEPIPEQGVARPPLCFSSWQLLK